MTESCPIHPDLVDEPSARIGAGLTILAAAAAVAAGRPWIPLLLAADFGLRSRGLVKASPIAQLSRALRTAAGLRPRPVNAGPKRFAALVGAGFSLAIALAQFRHHPRAALAIAAVLVLCASLEAFVGYCVGCKVYSLIQALVHHLPADPPNHTEHP